MLYLQYMTHGPIAAEDTRGAGPGAGGQEVIATATQPDRYCISTRSARPAPHVGSAIPVDGTTRDAFFDARFAELLKVPRRRRMETHLARLAHGEDFLNTPIKHCRPLRIRKPVLPPLPGLEPRVLGHPVQKLMW